MSLKLYKELDWSLFADPRYCNRKEIGTISFFYNTKEDYFIPVPVDVEHIDFLSQKIVGCSKEEIQTKSVNVSRYYLS